MTAPPDQIDTCLSKSDEEGRWFLAVDMNCDGLFTISDVNAWTHWLFFLPGDMLIWGLMQHEMTATFFELTPKSYGSIYSGAISVIGWLFVYGIGCAVSSVWDELFDRN